MPDRAKYERLPTRASLDESSHVSASTSRLSPSGPAATRRAAAPKSAVALEVDAMFRRWTSTIAQRLKLRRRRRRGGLKGSLVKQRDRSRPVRIVKSAFTEAADLIQSTSSIKGKEKASAPASGVVTLDHEPPMSREDFDSLVDQVRLAIDSGVHPRLNARGSSGSYFARDTAGQTLGIFKPKDEEPYGQLNPKLTKWIHRNLLSSIIPFGRACLIPQLSYLSESAASLLDRRLNLHIVPRTEVVPLSSPAFYYQWIDRERARSRHQPLPDKDGSFQFFLKGFQDASSFLREHPYPGRSIEQTFDDEPRQRGPGRRRKAGPLGSMRWMCGTAEAEEDDDDSDDEDGEHEHDFRWTSELMESFRLELEKLVILDYLIRNTDRGLDNFMMRACLCTSPPSTGSSTPTTRKRTTEPPLPLPPMSRNKPLVEQPTQSPSGPSHAPSSPHIHIAAIDNSLAFPHAHPSGWRTFPYGWLYLPVSLIGRPFSRQTREHFLPLLTSSDWWEKTTLALRNEFSKDSDFKESMFYRQLAVMKGQAWNAVQSLLDDEDGPIELCRRPKKLVWDDFVEAHTQDSRRPPSSRTDSVDAFNEQNGPVLTAPTPMPSSHLGANALEATTMVPSSAPSAAVPMADAPRTRPFRAHRRAVSSASIPTYHKTAALSVGSVMSGGAGPSQSLDSVTGVDMVKHLDWIEREERRGRIVFDRRQSSDVGDERARSDVAADTSDNESDGNEAEPWGVRSEGDVLQRPAYSPLLGILSSDSPAPATPSGDSSYGSLRAINADKSPTRKRSGSLTDVTDAPIAPRDSRASLDYDRRPSMLGSGRQARGYSRRSVDGGDRRLGNGSASWLGDDTLDEIDEDDAEADEAEDEASHREVVVIERLESLKDEPTRIIPSWCC